MAIKMKHSGNATATTFASMGGGQGKRRAEDARAFAQIAASQNAAANRQLQGAHASPVSAAAPHAQLISAPTGGGAHAIPGPGGVGASARLGGGGGLGSSSRAGRTSVSSGSGASADEDLKITGTDRFSRPDEESVWSDTAGKWMRKWLPGEKEAEATKRIGMAQNEVYEDRELTSQGRREREALVNDVVKAVQTRQFSNAEMDKLIASFGEAEDRIRFADQFRAKEPTAQEQLRKNTYTDERGIVWSPDGKVLYNPNDAIIKQQEFAMKREDALRARADKFELELRKPRRATGVDEDGLDKTGYEDLSEEDISAIMQKKFPSLYPSAGNGGNGGGTGDPAITPITPTFDETRFPNATKAAQAAAAERNAVPAQAAQQDAATAQPAPANNDAYSAYADYEKK